MDIGFDHTPLTFARQDAAPAGLDWHGLRARFLAAQSCRIELSPEPGARPAVGSFDAAVAQALAGYDDDTPGINPNGLADRKSDRRDEQTTPGHAGPTFEGNDD